MVTAEMDKEPSREPQRELGRVGKNDLSGPLDSVKTIHDVQDQAATAIDLSLVLDNRQNMKLGRLIRPP